MSNSIDNRAVIYNMQFPEELKNQVLKFQNDMQKVIDKYNFRNVDYDEVYNQQKNAIRLIAKNGWSIVGDLTFRDVNNIRKLSNSEEIDKWFIEYYSHAEYKEFERITSLILRCKFFGSWKQLIEQCIINFKNNYYTITIPSLITIIEGACAKLLNTTDYGERLKARLFSVNFDEKKVENLVWLSLGQFYKKLFLNRDFGSEESGLINRNWILHGRDITEWDIADSLRLFNTLYTIYFIVCRNKP